MVENLTTKCFMSLVLVSKENVPFRSSYPRKHVLSSVEGRVSRLIRPRNKPGFSPAAGMTLEEEPSSAEMVRFHLL